MYVARSRTQETGSISICHNSGYKVENLWKPYQGKKDEAVEGFTLKITSDGGLFCQSR